MKTHLAKVQISIMSKSFYDDDITNLFTEESRTFIKPLNIVIDEGAVYLFYTYNIDDDGNFC